MSSGNTLITSASSAENSNASVGGVGTVVSNGSFNCLLSAENISPRFSGYPQTTYICCYSPHNQSPEEDVLNFYDQLSEVMRQISAHNVVFLCGDFYAQLGFDHSYHQQTNRNGEHLFNFMEIFGLVAVNTLFQKPSRKLWTCQYPNGSRGQLDYILVRRKWVRSVTHAQSYATTFSTPIKKHQSDLRSINFPSLTGMKDLQIQYSFDVHNRFTSLIDNLHDPTSVQEISEHLNI